jgi:hypothetical protein
VTGVQTCALPIYFALAINVALPSANLIYYTLRQFYRLLVFECVIGCH